MPKPSGVCRKRCGSIPTTQTLTVLLARNPQRTQNEAVEAVQHYREALRIRPDFPEALNNLALMLATSKEADIRNAAHAIPLAERACELTLLRNTGLHQHSGGGLR
jgi:tetratricopeptide (TPR) repeat protein